MARLPDLAFTVKAKDEATQTLNRVKESTKQVESGFKLVTPATIAFATATTALAVAAFKAVQEFAQQEVAVRRLNDALKTAGVFTEAYSQHLQEFAGDMQNLTQFADDQVLQIQELMVTFGAYGKVLDQATINVLDFATAIGTDALSAGRLLARAVEGNTELLTRYGIQIDQSVPKSERFAAAMTQIQEKMGGRAAAAGDTLSGSFIQFKNQLGDTLELVGEMITRVSLLQRTFEFLKGSLVTVQAVLGSLLNSQTASSLKLQVKLFGDLAKLVEKIGESLPKWLGGGAVLSLAKEARDLQNVAKAQLKEITEEQQNALEVATQQYENKVAIAKQEEIRLELLKEQEKIEKTLLSYQESEKRAAIAASAQDAIASGSLIAIEKQRQALESQKKLVDLQQRVNQEKFKYDLEQHKMLTQQIDQLRQAAQDIRQGAQLSLAQGALSANAGQIGTSAATLAGASAGTATMVGLLIELVQSADKLPEAIGSMLEGLMHGITEGIPKLVEYLTGQFLQDLLTKFIPALVEGMSRLIPALVAGMARAIGTLVTSLPEMGFNIITGVAEGLWEGLKDIGSAIASFFGFGGDDRSPLEKYQDTIKELQAGIHELNKTLKEMSEDARRSIMSPSERLSAARSDFNLLRTKQHHLIGQFRDAAYAGDTERAAELVQQLAETQAQQIQKAKEIYDLENQRLDLLLQKERDLFQDQLQYQEDLKRAAESALNNLKNLQSSALNALQAARASIVGDALGPSGNLALLQSQFDTAKGADAKSAAAQALAGGIQAQYAAIQSLAAQGAITGEEFAKQREELLNQLEKAEAQTTSDFQKMIAAQQAIIDKADKQINILKAGFAAFEKQIEAQRAELKSYLNKVIDRLEDVNKSIKKGATGSWSPSSYYANVDGIKATVKYG